MKRTELQVDANVIEIISRMQQNGFEALIVGGAVRDLMLGFTPKDYDIATSASPEEVKALFGRRARIIGRRFRLVHVYHGHNYYEVSTFRREPTAEERSTRDTDDGTMIWRDNAYGNLEQDAQRRDFTINAVYYDPLDSGLLIDYCNGIADLEGRVVRAIGNPETRLAEDPVRILRALKLVAQYDCQPEPGLVKALQNQAATLTGSSQARLFEELLKICHKPYMHSTFSVFHEYGLLKHFLPELHRHWTANEIGAMTRKLLQERDKRQATGKYSQSRTLALATMVMPVAAAAIGMRPGQPLWEHQHGLENTVTDTIRQFFAPLPVPRVLIARTRDVILLLPRFLTTAHRKRVLNHPEYRYARELFSILTEVNQWAPESIAHWPQTGTRSHYRSRRPRQKHVRRSHPKSKE